MKSCENENSQDRKSVIDIIKGIAILAVIITHTSWTKEERLSYLFPFWIDQAVPVFMIMSGYVNSLSYCKKRLENLTEAFVGTPLKIASAFLTIGETTALAAAITELGVGVGPGGMSLLPPPPPPQPTRLIEANKARERQHCLDKNFIQTPSFWFFR